MVETLFGLVVVPSFLWNVKNLTAEEASLSFPWWLFLAGYVGGILWILVRVLVPRSPP